MLSFRGNSIFYKILLVMMLPFAVHAAKKTVCLSMIVKDERPVILKCLESVKPLIDYWVIVDTGSTDGTQKAILEFMKEIPGELHQRPWVNFAHNRNEALELARKKADYCLIIDADQIIVAPPSSNLETAVGDGKLTQPFDPESLPTGDPFTLGECESPAGSDSKSKSCITSPSRTAVSRFQLPLLTHDLYAITIQLTQLDGAVSCCPREFLIKSQLECKWEGVIHEKIATQKPPSIALVESLFLKTDMTTGHRSQDPQKYLKDAKTLEKALESEPQNATYQFHLGASYELAGDFQKALDAFEKCAQMKSADADQRYRSLFQKGVLQERLGKNPSLFLASYDAAFRYCPSRAEPLFFAANHYVSSGSPQKAYELLKEAVKLPLPTHQAFVERSIYTWAALYNLMICAETLGKTEETYQLLDKLLLCSELPSNLRQLVLKKHASTLNQKF